VLKNLKTRSCSIHRIKTKEELATLAYFYKFQSLRVKSSKKLICAGAFVQRYRGGLIVRSFLRTEFDFLRRGNTRYTAGANAKRSREEVETHYQLLGRRFYLNVTPLVRSLARSLARLFVRWFVRSLARGIRGGHGCQNSHNRERRYERR